MGQAVNKPGPSYLNGDRFQPPHLSEAARWHAGIVRIHTNLLRTFYGRICSSFFFFLVFSYTRTMTEGRRELNHLAGFSSCRHRWNYKKKNTNNGKWQFGSSEPSKHLLGWIYPAHSLCYEHLLLPFNCDHLQQCYSNGRGIISPANVFRAKRLSQSLVQMDCLKVI